MLGRTETLRHKIEVEDYAEAMLQYKNGATGYIHASTNEPEQGIAMDITFDRGRLTYRDEQVHLSTYAKPLTASMKARKVWDRPVVTTKEVKVRAVKHGHYQVIRNFARHILYRDKLLCSGQSGLASLELANAILLSSHRGRQVNLPTPRRAYDALLKDLRDNSTFRKKVVKGVHETDPARLKT